MPAFLFSLNSVLPLFLIIALGFVFKRMGVLTLPVVSAFNTIAFNITLPLMLFRDIATADFSKLFAPYFILYAIAATVLLFVVIWLFAEWFVKDKTSIGAFVQGAFRGNYAIIGLFLLLNVLGYTGKGALVMAFVVPVYNMLSVVVLSFRGRNPQHGNIRHALLNIVKNPLIIGIVAGIPFSLFHIPVFTCESFKFVGTTAGHLINLTNPLALLAIGASISRDKLKAGWRNAAVATFLKIVAGPLVLTGIAYLLRGALGFSGEDLLVLFVLFAVPTAVASYIMASKMDNDADLAANIVLLTSIFSIFTLTFGVFIFKTAGLI